MMQKSQPKVYFKLRNQEMLDEIRSVLNVISSWMAMPLFFLFWIVDIISYPDLKWPFLFIRCLIIPVSLISTRLANKVNEAPRVQKIALFYLLCMGAGINLMIFMINDPGTAYYAGLNLIAIGGLFFIPFSKKYFFLTTVGIYFPYYLITGYQLIGNPKSWTQWLSNSFFVLSSIIICYLIRIFNETLRIREVNSRMQLKSELDSREEIIRVQTDEAVRLRNLSTQFSPQIVESIRSGNLKLESTGQRAEICAIFIDIVNSTERVTRIDKDKVDRVLTKFLEDSIKILLKYDITIDKFLGDGILAFCNAPFKRIDYASRVIKAALEIRERVQLDDEFYEKNWDGPLTLRMGIARGFVNVGFYGSKKYYQSYTAIGPVVNLASRLCSSAEPGQIVMENDVYEMVVNEFNTEFLGKRILKGFERDIVHVYRIISSKDMSEKSGANISECPTCGGILSLETNVQGQFVFMCRACSTVIDTTAHQSNNPSIKKIA